jgi:hypothetical protein
VGPVLNLFKLIPDLLQVLFGFLDFGVVYWGRPVREDRK